MYQLAVAYEEGYGIDKNRRLSIFWVNIAMKNGYKEATYDLGQILSRTANPECIAHVVDILEMLVHEGNVGVMCRLADIYTSNYNYKDLTKAVEWMKTGIVRGSIICKQMLCDLKR